MKALLQEAAGPQDFTGKFYQTFREEITPILHKNFQKIVEEGTLSNSLYESYITRIKSYEH